MKTINVRFKDEVVKVLEMVSEETELTKSSIVRKAVRQFLEDYMDVKEAKEILSDPELETLTSEEVEKELDL